MAEPVVLAFRLLNGLLTIGFLPLLLKVYGQTLKRFYRLWGAGFALYGLHILVRAVVPVIAPEALQTIQIYSFFLQLVGFGLILAGVGELVNRTRAVVLSFISVPIILLILFFTTQPYLLGRMVSVTPYLYIVAALIIIRLYYNVAIEAFIIGWTTLLLANLGSALDLMTPLMLEVFAVEAKAVLLYGTLYPRFSFLVDDMTRFLISGQAAQYDEERRGGIIMVNSKASKRDELKYIARLQAEAAPKGIRTILISAYDLITLQEIRGVTQDTSSLYFVRVIQGTVSPWSFSESQIITINDDPSSIGLLLSEILGFVKEKKVSCQIIVHNLSTLIITHGWMRLYSLLISNIGTLKVNGVNLYLLYYDDIHTNHSEIAKFETMAERVETIGERSR
jgi:hypothetical protein